MRYRRVDDGGFGSGMGGGFGTSGYDPHRSFEGPYTTRGVGREGSRVPRSHEDEHPQMPPSQQSQPGYMQPHFSERAAHESYTQQQHGYGLSQYAYPEQGYGRGGTDLGMGERFGDDRGPHYGKGPKGYKRSDDRIRDEICEAIAQQGFIDASDVEVFVEAGVVRLVGLVETRQDKRGLEQMADRVHGVDEVQNEVRLRRTRARTAEATATAPTSSRAPVSQNGRTASS